MQLIADGKSYKVDSALIQPESLAQLENLQCVPRWMQCEYKHEFLSGCLPQDRMSGRNSPQIAIAALHVLNRARSASLKVFQRFAERREFSARPHGFRRPNLLTAVRRAADDLLLAAAIGRGF